VKDFNSKFEKPDDHEYHAANQNTPDSFVAIRFPDRLHENEIRTDRYQTQGAGSKIFCKTDIAEHAY
jgi:hypothetical protein